MGIGRIYGLVVRRIYHFYNNVGNTMQSLVGMKVTIST